MQKSLKGLQKSLKGLQKSPKGLLSSVGASSEHSSCISWQKTHLPLHAGARDGNLLSSRQHEIIEVDQMLKCLLSSIKASSQHSRCESDSSTSS